MRAWILAAVLVVATACEVGDRIIAERTVELSEFDAVRIDKQFDVEVIVAPGSAYSVTFRTDSNLLDDDEIGAVVDARELSFRLPTQELNGASERRAIVRTPTLKQVLVLDGSSATLVATGLTGDNFHALCGNLAKATLSGQVDAAILVAEGTCALDASGLTVRTAELWATERYQNAPTLSARVTESVTVKTEGAAKVRVLGSPANVVKNENASAEVVVE